MTDQPILILDHVTTSFRQGWGRRRHVVTAMDEVSFAIARGETLGLVGESGSGKSTTGAVALGLQSPDSGTVLFDGGALGRRGDRVGRIQAVLQNPQWSLNPRLRVADSIAEPLTVVRGGRLREHRDTVIAMLDAVGLEPAFADRYPHQLSGGQCQRVSIARALVTQPEFIVFDEAVSALDVSVQAQILNLIKDLQAERGFGALFISHDLAAVRYLAHRIAVMKSGQVVELAETKRFYGTPTHPYSRQLLEAL